MLLKNVMYLLITLMLGCSSEQSLLEAKLDELYHADPVVDAQKAIKAKDYRLLGTYDYSASVPHAQKECLDFNRDVKMIEGTSDVEMSYKESQFNSLAILYARRYNFHMMLYLKEHGLYKCDKSLAEN